MDIKFYIKMFLLRFVELSRVELGHFNTKPTMLYLYI